MVVSSNEGPVPTSLCLWWRWHLLVEVLPRLRFAEEHFGWRWRLLVEVPPRLHFAEVHFVWRWRLLVEVPPRLHFAEVHFVICLFCVFYDVYTSCEDDGLLISPPWSLCSFAINMVAWLASLIISSLMFVLTYTSLTFWKFVSYFSYESLYFPEYYLEVPSQLCAVDSIYCGLVS